jgi:LacI family transcriptional regulator
LTKRRVNGYAEGMASRIIDIAQAAEVSPSTVSLALNNKSGVSDEVKQRIVNIAVQMGYKNVYPEQYYANEKITIRLLKIAKHGHIINDRHNAFITEYLEGIETEAKKRKYKLEISFFDRVTIEKIIETQIKAEVGGIIVLGTELNNYELAFFTELRRPIVFIDTYFPLSVYDCVDMDNVDGVFKAIQHLYEYGHRSIGLVKSSYDTRNFRMREFGFREAMEYFSLPVQEKFIIDVDPAYDGSIRDISRYLDRNKSLPTAFFCMSDIMAYSVIRALHNYNIEVPDQVSVIGFDDLPTSSFTEPPLTTIRVSSKRIGQRAVEKLCERIANFSDHIPENILISGKLISRGSVRKI